VRPASYPVSELSRQLAFGGERTRGEVADRLLADGRPAWWDLLARTAWSGEPWRVRAGCLDVLGRVAGRSDEATAEQVLAAVTAAVAAYASRGTP
jgi:hypothetical protein